MEQIKVNIINSSTNPLPAYETGSFDVVTLWHVMEHLQNLNETWERIYSLLSDRGILVVAVPNPTSFDARFYKEMWAAYDVPRHLWHFAPSVIQQFGAKHGFILTERHPMPFDAFYVSMLSEKYRKSSFPFVKGMLKGMEAGLASLVKKERSSSMIYVFQKKVKA
jgi:SAM-dependent methyltransferase